MRREHLFLRLPVQREATSTSKEMSWVGRERFGVQSPRSSARSCTTRSLDPEMVTRRAPRPNCSNDGAGAPTTSYVVALAHEQEESQLLRRPNDPPLLLLTSLASGPKHGYALLKDIEEFPVSFESGHALRCHHPTRGVGLIEPVAEVERRRPYRITTDGRQVLREVTTEMRRLADVGVARLRLAARGV